jgi:exosortase/archaeosortase family protein
MKNKKRLDKKENKNNHKKNYQIQENINKIKDIILRYAFLLIIGLFGLNLFYFLFSNLTISIVYKILSLFFNTSLSENIILINSYSIEIIGACIAGAGYYLFLILSFSVPNLSLIKRIFITLFSWILFFLINLTRIILLSFLLVSGNSYFDLTHNLFWFFGSTLFVVLIWLLTIKIFKIKGIPFYQDLIYLLKNSSFNKKNKKLEKTINFLK